VRIFKLLKTLILTAGLLLPALAHADDWLPPNPQELSMTVEPAAPNAAAIYLYREEICDGRLNTKTIYVRLKILSEEGRKYADVEIPYEHWYFAIENLNGRTIHRDGSIVPLAANAYQEMIARRNKDPYQNQTFSLPDVQVGSVLEYRYTLRYSEYSAIAPTWYVQGELFLRKAHFRFVTTDAPLMTGREEGIRTVAFLPILPQGVTVKRLGPQSAGILGQIGVRSRQPDAFELDAENIPAEPDEEYLPPVHSLTFRVYFIYSPYHTTAEYWEKEGKYWSDDLNQFMNAKKPLSEMVSQLTLPSDNEDQRLQKLYNAVMAYENSDFTRERSRREEKKEGFKEVRTVKDIMARQRGSSDDLTLLFVALARASGMKAYVMAITNRDKEIFNPNLMSMAQLDDYIAIVNVDGKERFFDPGERYCPYGQLHWKHTMGGGIRQTETGTTFANAPDNLYSRSRTVRVADLTMGPDGRVTGKLRVGYSGVPALAWRQGALKADQTEVERDMEHAMQAMLPSGITVKLDSVQYLDDPSKQLVTSFSIEGPLAIPSGKRMFVPCEIFQANARPMFTQPHRTMPVYFNYGYQEIDQISITLPAAFATESVPQKEKFTMQQLAEMQEGATMKGNTMVLTRDFQLGAVIFKAEEYDALHSFYANVLHKDQEQVILRASN